MAKHPEMRVPSLALQPVNGGKGAPPAQAAAPAAPDLVEDGPGLTLYTKRHTYLALKHLALSERTTVHALLIEAVRMLFESRSLSATADAGNRPGSPKRTTSVS